MHLRKPACWLICLAIIFSIFCWPGCAAAQQKSPSSVSQDQLNELKTQLNDIDRRFHVIKELWQKRYHLIKILSRLNQLMPEEIKLDSISIKRELIIIEGNCQFDSPITEFAKNLEFSAGLFYSLTLSIETVDTAITKYRFTLRCYYNFNYFASEQFKAIPSQLCELTEIESAPNQDWQHERQAWLIRRDEAYSQLRDLREYLPETTDSSTVFQLVSESAYQTGITVKKFQNDGLIGKDYYRENYFAVQLMGNYQNIGKFLQLLGQGRRITAIPLITIKKLSSQSDKNSIEANFTLIAYYGNREYLTKYPLPKPVSTPDKVAAATPQTAPSNQTETATETNETNEADDADKISETDEATDETDEPPRPSWMDLATFIAPKEDPFIDARLMDVKPVAQINRTFFPAFEQRVAEYIKHRDETRIKGQPDPLLLEQYLIAELKYIGMIRVEKELYGIFNTVDNVTICAMKDAKCYNGSLYEISDYRSVFLEMDEVAKYGFYVINKMEAGCRESDALTPINLIEATNALEAAARLKLPKKLVSIHTTSIELYSFLKMLNQLSGYPEPRFNFIIDQSVPNLCLSVYYNDATFSDLLLATLHSAHLTLIEEGGYFRIIPQTELAEAKQPAIGISLITPPRTRKYFQPGYSADPVTITGNNYKPTDIFSFITGNFGPAFSFTVRPKERKFAMSVIDLEWTKVLTAILRAHRLALLIEGDATIVIEREELLKLAAQGTVKIVQ